LIEEFLAFEGSRTSPELSDLGTFIETAREGWRPLRGTPVARRRAQPGGCDLLW
jgi:hypothetical protein